MSQFPQTRAELLRARYTFIGSTGRSGGQSVCLNCEAAIEWWRTPRGKNMPINLMPPGDSAAVVPHWHTCPEVKEFRGARALKPPAKPPTPLNSTQREKTA